MSREANTALVRRLVAEIWNRANLAAADELYAPDFSVNGDVIGPAGARRNVASLATAMPDLHYTIDDLVADGDRVVLRVWGSGTHTGEWAHPIVGQLAPTGRRFELRTMTMYRIVDGKLAEAWTFRDSLGLLKQLGATITLPSPVANTAR
jgi:predicted ester cyclase